MHVVTNRMIGGAALGVASVGAYRKVLRPYHERWGTSEGEATASLPGDELTEEPASQATRAITIDAPRDEVWRWVIQIGADRGGFYSYDWLENVFALGIHSADEIVPQWQQRAVGDLMYGDGKGRGGWLVMEVQPSESLVVKTANFKNKKPVERDEPPAFWEFTWAFVLKDLGDGRTRLLVRERVGFGTRISQLLMSPFGLVSFVMTRKMMLGIKERAEASFRVRGSTRLEVVAATEVAAGS